MKAAICTKYGSPEVVKIKEVQKPEPKNNEILIRVHASTIASGDCRIRGCQVPGIMKVMMKLMFGFSKPRHPILGTELSGVIEQIGRSVRKFKVGDAVIAMTGMKMGAHAEYVCVSENMVVVPKPADITFEQAAAIAFGGTTALHFLRSANIQDSKKGKNVLIYGASGAVGTYAVQIAKHFGALVTGVCSTQNLDLAKSIGADFVIDYTKEDFAIKAKYYDIIFDAVGKISQSDCKHILMPEGNFVSVSKGVASERVEDLLFLKELIESDQVHPVIDRCYDLEDIVEAYKYVDTGRKKGNVVLKIANGEH